MDPWCLVACLYFMFKYSGKFIRLHPLFGVCIHRYFNIDVVEIQRSSGGKNYVGSRKIHKQINFKGG